MIYFFYWNNGYILEETAKKWKNTFHERYWDIQLNHFKDYSEHTLKILKQTLLSRGLFQEKKLLIFDWIPHSANSKDSHLLQCEELLKDIILQKDDSTIVLLTSLLPDKRWKFFKSLKTLEKNDKKIIQIQELNVWNENDSLNFLKNRYQNIDKWVLSYILKIKSWHIEKVIPEIEKLFISSQKITIDLISNNVQAELEQSIFQLIDHLVFWRKQEALQDLEIILQQSDIMSLYYSLLSNLRLIVYIKILEKVWNKRWQIITLLELWNRSFLLEKYAFINSWNFVKLYVQLCNADKKMKKWELSAFSHTPLRDEIESLILCS